MSLATKNRQINNKVRGTMAANDVLLFEGSDGGTFVRFKRRCHDFASVSSSGPGVFFNDMITVLFWCKFRNH